MAVTRKKVILCFPSLKTHDADPQSPLAIMALCPEIEARGFEPVLIDMRVEPAWKQEIARHLGEALWVGISSMSGPQLHFALEMASYVRASDPDVPIVWGGMHPTLFPEQTAAHPLVDIVARATADETVGDLCACLAEGGVLSKVAGICFTDQAGKIVVTAERGEFDMRKVRIPPWHRIELDRYTAISVETARGCPHRCAFCYNVGANRRKWHTKPAPLIMEELTMLRKKYGISNISMVDDNFFTNFERAGKLAQMMVDADLGIRWSTTCRAGYLARWDDDYIELLKRSGVFVLFAGIESGSPRILEHIQKDTKVEEIERAAKRANQHQLRMSTTYIVGFPTETIEDWHLTFGLMDRLRAIHPDIFIDDIFVYAPYPGTALFDESIRHGFTPPTDLEGWSAGWFNERLPWLTPQQQDILGGLTFLARFVFKPEEIRARFVGPHRWRLPFYLALRADAVARWRTRRLGHSPEFALLRKMSDRVSRKARREVPDERGTAI